MAPGSSLQATLQQLAVLACQLPTDAEITVEWPDALPDLLLAIALQEGGQLHVSPLLGEQIHRAEWVRGGLVVRAARRSAVASENENTAPRSR